MSAEGKIALTGEVLFKLGSLPITNTFLLFFIVEVVLVLFLFLYKFKKLPGKLQVIFEKLYEFIDDIASSVLDKRTRQDTLWFFFLMFLLILLNNYVGLLPGVETVYLKSGDHKVALFKGANSDINLTLALGAITFLFVHLYALKRKGLKHWIKHFFHTKPLAILPLFIFVGLLELTLEPVKFVILGVRLLGNILAGETLVYNMSKIPGVAIPFLLFELLVGFLQALVFVALSITYLGLLLKEEH